MKYLLFVVLALIGVNQLYSQNTNYKVTDYSKFEAVGSQLVLSETSEEGITLTEQIGIGTIISQFLPAAIDIFSQIRTNKLSKKLKSYSAEYSGKLNFGMDDESSDKLNALKKIKVVRYIQSKGGGKTKALTFLLSPKKNGKSQFFYFIEKIDLDYSDARISKEHPVIDLTVEIELTYLDTSKMEYVKAVSSPITFPMLGNQAYIYSELAVDNFNNIRYESDNFVLSPFISGMSIKCTEANPAKIELEEYIERRDTILPQVTETTKQLIEVIFKEDDDEPEDGDAAVGDGSVGGGGDPN